MADKKEVLESLKRITCELKEIQRDVDGEKDNDLPTVEQLDDVLYLLRDYIPEVGDEYSLHRDITVENVTVLVFVKE